MPLPKIFHLHGNVRVSYCSNCKLSLLRASVCPTCSKEVTPTQLLYPVHNKNYASDGFVSTQWDAVRSFVSRAAYITIFGYSAPDTDQEAMQIFTEAWKGEYSEKIVNRVEIIDIADFDELCRKWDPFAHHGHYQIRRNFFESSLARYPRRTCEALAHSGFLGQVVENIPWAGSLAGLQESIKELLAHEPE